MTFKVRDKESGGDLDVFAVWVELGGEPSYQNRSVDVYLSDDGALSLEYCGNWVHLPGERFEAVAT